MTEHPIRLMAFDVEGTLAEAPTVWERMHGKLGTWQSHGLKYLKQYVRGDLDYDTFARMDVAAWKGARAALLKECADEVSWMLGARDVLRSIAAHGTHVALISNGLDVVADRLAAEVGGALVFANHAVVKDGTLTGELDLRVGFHDKGATLHALTNRLGLTRAQVAAAGDGPNDISMFEHAGLSIAFRPEDARVAGAATHVLRDGLGPVLGLIKCALS